MTLFKSKVTLRQDNAPPSLPFRWGIGRLIASAVAAGMSVTASISLQ
jgi:hypothetical protein